MNSKNILISNDRCFIIAEAGVNHNGNIELAKKLVDAALDANADAIKFQSFITDNIVSQKAEKADYQKIATGGGNQYAMLKKLELSYEDHLTLKNYCDEKGILFVSTPFDFESVDLLEKIHVPFYKISSGDLTNIPLLRYIAGFNKPIILSTGMSNLGEIEEAISNIFDSGNKNITLLHCTSNYPTDFEDVNLNAMITIRDAFKLPVGYSDHTVGIEIPIAAVAIGAKIIEKHFTLDKNMPGPDHSASLNPTELKQMVESIRNIEKSLGNGIKKCSNSEISTKKIARKSIVCRENIKAGDIITYDNISIKRPSGGIDPKYIGEIIGKRAICNIEKDDLVLWNQIK